MRKLLNKKSGFTLIELMIVVAILGILAAIAIPAFVTYVRRSKTVEATENINTMFTAVSTYYVPAERQAQGVQGSQFMHCTVDSANDAKAPGAEKGTGAWDTAVWDARSGGIGFKVEFGYYQYAVASGPGLGCNRSANNLSVYTLRAVGNLDSDAVFSTFEQAVGSSSENELYRSRGFYVVNETE